MPTGCLFLSSHNSSTEGSTGWKQRAISLSSWRCLHYKHNLHTHLTTLHLVTNTPLTQHYYMYPSFPPPTPIVPTSKLLTITISGSSSEFSVFRIRIQAKVPDPSGSIRIQIQPYYLSLFGNFKHNHLKFNQLFAIFYLHVRAPNYLEPTSKPGICIC